MRIAQTSKVRACCIELLESRRLLSTYYVSPSGSDNSPGNSADHPWRSIARVNSQAIHPGDAILFQGGQSFSGSLYFPSTRGGTATSPVHIGAYGTGPATIRSGGSNAINVAQTAGFDISNLNLIGSGLSANRSNGIFFHLDWSSLKLSHVHIDNVQVSGYGGFGIMIKGVGSGSGYNDVRVTNADLHDNGLGGMGMWSEHGRTHSDVYVAHVRAYNNPGDGSTGHVSGSGIFLCNIDGGTIERCVAYNNGTRGAAPVGIWASGCNRMTFQHNESYNNHTMTGTDGGGFDFDWDMVNSTMQFNYSHGNDGPAFLIAGGTHPAYGNIIRYNISENDGRKNGRGAIQIWGGVSDTSIYGNTIYMGRTGNADSAAIRIHNAGAAGYTPSNVQIRNNIFYATGGVKVVSVSGDVVAKASNLKFLGNAYYAGGSTVQIQWGNNVYHSLSSWQGTRQETSSGALKGYQGDPKLSAAGSGGTIGNADSLERLSAYRLNAGSPLINRGVMPPTVLSSALADFYGDAIPRSGTYDIGADEAA